MLFGKNKIKFGQKIFASPKYALPYTYASRYAFLVLTARSVSTLVKIHSSDYRSYTRIHYLHRSIAKLWGFEGQITFLGGRDFVFIISLKQIFLDITEFRRHKKNLGGAVPVATLKKFKCDITYLVYVKLKLIGKYY